MDITVRYLFFGATAGVVRQRQLEMGFEPSSTVSEAIDQITQRFPDLKKHKLLCALNQNYISGDELLHDGDEVAIFTAVSGG